MNTLKLKPASNTRFLQPGKRNWAPAGTSVRHLSVDKPNRYPTHDNADLPADGGFIDIFEVISFYINHDVVPVADMKKLYKDLQALQ